VSNLKRIIVYRNAEYEVCEWAIKEAEHNGLAFTDEYITYLLENDSPFSSRSLDLLAHYDIANRKYIGSTGLLGRVVKLDKNGNILGYFESVFDASMDAISGNHKFSFENLHNSDTMLNKETYNFFGIIINTNSSGAEHEIISELNTIIRKNRNRYLGKNKTFREMYTDAVASRMTYDEYVRRGIQWNAFQFGECIRYLIGNPSESKYTKHIIENCNDYTERMRNLFQRYSFQTKCAFSRIYDLNKVKGFSGIYLLCLPQIKGCYVGKTGKCFATRIVQHFKTPNSAFDKKYKPTDIKEIYVLQLDETMQLIDSIEEDCIATLGKEICLNALAGGKSIELIKSEEYDEKQHLLPPNTLQWVAEDSLNIAMYRTACAENA